MRRRTWLVGLPALVMLALVWALWPSHDPVAEPSSGPTRPVGEPAARGPATPQSFHGTPLPRASIVSALPARPCLEGTVIDATTQAPIARAEVVFATKDGAQVAQTSPEGRFGVDVHEGQVTLAEVSAAGYFAFRPDWGHSPVELTLTQGSCVSDLVLALIARVVYRGRVVNPSGEGLGGATVTVAEEDAAAQAPILTAADGTFAFFARQGAIIEARHAGFVPSGAHIDFRVQVAKELVLTLVPSPLDGGLDRARLTGVVVDGRDAGMPGAWVTARRNVQVEQDHWERIEASTQSDEAGRFELAADGPPPWTLGAELPGTRSTPVATSGEPVVLRVLEGATLTGTVTDSGGRPVASFSVLSRPRLGALRLGGEIVRNFVDGQGRFVIAGLPPGPLQVLVAGWGFAPSAPLDVVLELGATSHVEVTLSSGARLSGKVLDRGNKAPIHGAQVSLEERQDTTLALNPQASTDEQGRFTLTGMRQGRGSIFATAEGHHARLWSIVVPEGDGPVDPMTLELSAIAAGDTPRLELVGVGVVMSPSDDGLAVQKVLASGGAAEAGLTPGDTILSIDGTPVLKLGFQAAIQGIRGEEGTSVALVVRRADGTTVQVEVPRRRIQD